MRSLQRLRHVRPHIDQTPFQKARIHKLETKAVKRREREIWMRRIRRTLFLIGVALTTVGGMSILAGSRVVAGGVVRSSVVTEPAPGRVRVTHWFVHAGGSVAKGEPLVRLEPANPDGSEAVLRAAILVAEAQLTWFDAGGELELGGMMDRDDLAMAAGRSATLEKVGEVTAGAEVAVRENALAVARAARREIEDAARGEKSVLVARRATEEERRSLAEITLLQAVQDEKRAMDLTADGVQSTRAAEVASAAAASAGAQLRLAEAELAALSTESERVELNVRAAIARAESEISVAESRLAAARTSAEVASKRGMAWRAEAKYHDSLAPIERRDLDAIRVARRARLSAEVDAARATLDAHRISAGSRTLLAASDGHVDEIFASENSVVERGDPLVRYGKSEGRVVIYVSPATATTLAIGQECAVRCPADGSQATATVQAIGRVWVNAPGRGSRSAGPKRVVVTLEVSSEAFPFSANSAVKAAFQSDRWTALKHRVLGWFEK